MQLTKPSFQLLTPPEVVRGMLQRIEQAGRTCYKSEDKITPTSAEEFVTRVVRLGHESVIEHESLSVRIICDRGVTHEIVRHRLASYSQESTRYCDYGNGHVEFIIPPWSDIEEGEYDLKWDGLYGTCPALEGQLYNHGDRHWAWAMALAEREYKKLREGGWSPQQARSVLPNSLKTEIVVTANLREWRHFFRLRTSTAAHPQMREIAIPMEQQFRELLPAIFV